MPNHVTNIVTIRATNVDEILESLKGEDSEFDFNTVVPCPESEGDNWYNWNCNNWGTKWNSYGVEFHGDDTVSFDTAWSHPQPVMEALSAKFPDATFEVKFADEDIGHNAAHCQYEDGVLNIIEQSSSQSADYDFEYWANFALDIKGYDEEGKAEFWSYQNEDA